MNILVTGALGFIASHTIEELLKEKNNTIIGIDNFYSGTKENLEFLKSIDLNNKFTFIEADIRDFEDINEIMNLKSIEQVYHLAAIASVSESMKNPLLTHEVNIKGTLNILESSKQNNIKRILFSSSAAVYGDQKTQPKNETSLMAPISPYGYEKLICEQYLKLYNEVYNLETVILRYFNVYGKRQSSLSDYSGVISIFNEKFKNNEIPNIYGNGEQSRDFVHVKDISVCNIKAMNTSGLSGEIICVGTFIKTTVNCLFRLMNKKYNRSFKANYLKERDSDINESVCDNTKVKDILQLKTFKTFNEGIMEL